jgi:hypothetical protein
MRETVAAGIELAEGAEPGTDTRAGLTDEPATPGVVVDGVVVGAAAEMEGARLAVGGGTADDGLAVSCGSRVPTGGAASVAVVVGAGVGRGVLSARTVGRGVALGCGVAAGALVGRGVADAAAGDGDAEVP